MLAWWIFTFHKGAFGRLNERLSVRIAFSPFLLFVPYYLGYAPYLFTFGPSGGILYPLFAMLMTIPFGWIPYNPIEIELLKMLPRPLAYISQIPASPLAWSFHSRISPTGLLGFAVSILAIAYAWRMYKRRGKN